MYRKVSEKFEEWKRNPDKKALLVTGARQIGKTYSIREFGKSYDEFVEINFITQSSAAGIFSGALDADTIIMNLTAFTGKALIPHKTLIFLDEIQECPEARTAIKFLVEDGRFDYIESGSLLGVNYKKIKSVPVGFETKLQMVPMDFEEFCIANQMQDSVFQYLSTCYTKKAEVSESIHETMLRLFRYYTIVGGMPDAVKAFIETHDIGQVVEIQRNILSLYREDIIKYAVTYTSRITQIFDHIPSELDDKNRRFMMSALSKNARSREYEDAFMWLKDAGVALPCYNLDALTLPLKLNEKATIFKLFLNDCGLLCADSMENVQFDILQGDLSVNMGSILENVFAEALVSNGFELRYYNQKRIGELDFVVQQGKNIVPIEIKSGNDYMHHLALDHAMAVDEWKLSEGIVFCKGNVRTEQKIQYYPWYMIMFFRQEEMPEHLILDVDLSAIQNHDILSKA